MNWALKLGLVTVVTGLISYYSLFTTEQVVVAPKHNDIPPAPSQPEAVAELFDHLVLNQQVKDDYNVSTLQQNCAALVKCKQYKALFARYLSFKEALLEFQQAIAHLPLSSQLKELIDFQQRYFSDDEIRLLFADDNELQRFTIAKLEITQDDSLSEELKQQLLANLKASQPEHLSKALQPSEDLRSLSSQFKQAIQEQDYNQLAGEFGDAAATRLIALERRNKQWQRISEQLVEKITQLKQNYKGEQLDQQVSALLTQHLTPSQQRRFLALHPQT